MGYPQQPQNDPNQYPQQQQSGYPQSPTPGTPNLGSINFAAITSLENRPYLIAGIGGLVILFAYFFLPFYSASYPGVTVSGIKEGGFSYSFTGSQVAGAYALLNFAWLGGLVALAAAAIAALDIKLSPSLTPQLLTRIILGAGGVALLALILGLLQANSSGLGLYTVSDGVSAGYGFGLWIALLAAIATIVGGVMALRKTA